MTKIVHVTEAWAGGISTYVRNLIEAQLNDQHEVILVCDSETEAPSFPTLKIIKYKAGRSIYKAVTCALLIKKILKAQDPEVVITHSSFPGFYTRFFCKNKKFKLIHIPHAWPFLIKKNRLISIKPYLYKKLEVYLAKGTDVIVCMSREEYNQGSRAGIQKDKIQLIYTGIPELNAEPKKLSNFFREDDRINIGFIGRFDFQKGVDLLLDAILALEKNEDYHFSIVGKPIHDEQKIPTIKNLTHIEWIPNEQIDGFIKTMDYIILPSRWEGFSIVPLETMRSGRGVIVSETTSLHETVISDYNGFVLKDLSPNGIIETILDLKEVDPTVIGKNARHVYLSCYSFSNFYKKFRSLYEI